MYIYVYIYIYIVHLNDWTAAQFRQCGAATNQSIRYLFMSVFIGLSVWTRSRWIALKPTKCRKENTEREKRRGDRWKTAACANFARAAEQQQKKRAHIIDARTNIVAAMRRRCWSDPIMNVKLLSIYYVMLHICDMGIGHMGRGNCGPGYSRFNYIFFFCVDIIAHTSIAINLQMIVLAL